MPADPLQAPQHVRQVAAEDATIGVQLVDHDKAQIFEQLRPLGVVRQDPGMQHVGVAEHHMSAAADGTTGVRRRIAVVGVDTDLEARRFANGCRERVQLGELILGQCFGRKQVKGATRRIVQDRIQDRSVVAQRLSRCGRGRDNNVAPVERVGHHLGLMCVKLADPASAERRTQTVVQRRGKRGVPSGTRRQMSHGRDAVFMAGGLGKRGQSAVPRKCAGRHALQRSFEGDVFSFGGEPDGDRRSKRRPLKSVQEVRDGFTALGKLGAPCRLRRRLRRAWTKRTSAKFGASRRA